MGVLKLVLTIVLLVSPAQQRYEDVTNPVALLASFYMRSTPKNTIAPIVTGRRHPAALKSSREAIEIHRTCN
jgi:hypothetical protein